MSKKKTIKSMQPRSIDKSNMEMSMKDEYQEFLEMREVSKDKKQKK